jgi:hypothetical protein
MRLYLMAEKVGVPTGQVSEAGRPVFKTPEGELVSEKSVTIPMGNKFINIPSIHDGVRYSEDEIIDMLKENKIEATSVHDSMEDAVEAAKSRSSKLLARGGSMESQMDIFEDGGLMEEGGTVDPVSGNDVPTGSTQEEVRDDIDAKLSEGEFVLPADVVRYIGLENIMKMRDMAKEGLNKMEAMGQMGNSEEATMDDESDFDADIDSFIEGLDQDDVEEFAVGGLAGQPQGPLTPEEQAAQIYQQTSGIGFLPPGVQAPGTQSNLPQAPKITPGGTGAGGTPTYETKQYIGPNGEIRSFTFINGQAFPPIPEGFTLYDPTKVPEATTGVPTAKVTQQDGGDGPEDTTVQSAKVDPVSGIAKSFAEQNPDSKVAKTVKSLEDLNEKYNKSLALSLGSFLMGGGIAGLAGVAYGAYKYNKQANELNSQLNAELMEALGPAAENIIKDAGQLSGSRYTEEAVQKTYTDAVKAGASPALAAALATTTSRAFSEIPDGTDLAGFEQQTADIFRDVTGGSLQAGSAQSAMLSEQDFGLFDTEEERAAFYAGEAPVGKGEQAGTFQRTVNGIPVDDYSVQRAPVDVQQSIKETRPGLDPFTQGIFDIEAGALLGAPGTYTDEFGNVMTESDAPLSARGFQYSMSGYTDPVTGQQVPGLQASLTSPTSRSPSPTETARSIAATEAEARSVASGESSLSGSSFGSQAEAEAVANHGFGSDEQFDAIEAGFAANESSSDSGSDSGGSYCCTKMVDHELWTTRREFAMMHKWHREQPQWWRDGYDVWGNVVAETLLKKKTKFWTSVMQSFYDYHVKKKPRTLKSTLADAIIYPGVVAFGMLAKITGRHINAV